MWEAQRGNRRPLNRWSCRALSRLASSIKSSGLLLDWGFSTVVGVKDKDVEMAPSRAAPLVQITSAVIAGVSWLAVCLRLAWMWLIAVVCPLPLPLPLSLPSPAAKSHTGKMKPNRGEKWNFFFCLFCLHSITPDGFFSSLLFSRIILSFLLAGRVWSCLSSSRTIRSLSASLFLFHEVSEGRGYSSPRIKWAKWREWPWMFSCLFFSPQSHAPADLYLMTKNPQDAPSAPDVLEIEFKNGAWMQPRNYRTLQHTTYWFHCWLILRALLFHWPFTVTGIHFL